MLRKALWALAAAVVWLAVPVTMRAQMEYLDVYSVKVKPEKSAEFNALAMKVADANRRFSELLRTVKKGGSVVVTSHGKPVARVTPAVEDERVAEEARSALFARLKTQRAVNAGRWTCDELYDAP